MENLVRRSTERPREPHPLLECEHIARPGVGMPGLVGREAELRKVRSALSVAGSGLPTLLLVEGEAGVGKTSVLTAVAEDAIANGWRCIRATGVESESTLAYAGLLGLLTPLRDRVDDLPSPQAAALSSALGWDVTSGPGERFLIGGAVLSLLATAAADTATLALIDDVQWLDRESVDAIAFAAHRLRHDRVAFVLAQRSGTGVLGSLDGAEVMTLDGLDGEAAAAMLRGTIGEEVARRLVDQTAGNPLALIEISRALTPAQRAGAEVLPEAMPVGAGIRLRYDKELEALPAEGWRAVLLAAVHRDQTAAPILATLAADGVDPEEAMAAAGSVLRLDRAALSFRHPLLRSAALARASDAERRAAHRDVAAALHDGPDVVWHVAEAVIGYDDPLAAELSAIADADRMRLGYAAASRANERAASLTSDPIGRADRLATATEDAYLAGDADTVRRIGERVASTGGAQAAQARALAVLGALEMNAGTYLRARALLSRSAELGAGTALLRTLKDLAHSCFLLDDHAGAIGAAERAAEVADRTDAEQSMLAEYLIGTSHVLAGQFELGQPHLLRAIELLESEPGLREDPQHLNVSLFAAWWARDVGLALQYADRRLDRARELGALAALATGQSFASGGLAMLGDHRRAYAMAGESVELLALIGYASEGTSLDVLAYESAARGRHDEAAAVITRAYSIAASATTERAPSHIAVIDAFAALCRGDLARTVTVLEDQIERHGGLGSMLEPFGVTPDLVEAYLGLGRDDDARRATDRFARAQQPDAPPAVLAMVARCEGLVADDGDSAVAAYERALALHEVQPDPFERARTALLYGMHLRRSGRRVDARTQLEAAREYFASQDLTLWVRRAETEVAATGRRAQRSGTDEPLTSQETRVALLVAQGRTNKEVAAALFLSPKTVEHHLGSVLRKRGLRSRTELAHHLAQETVGQQAGAPSGD